MSRIRRLVGVTLLLSILLHVGPSQAATSRPTRAAPPPTMDPPAAIGRASLPDEQDPAPLPPPRMAAQSSGTTTRVSADSDGAQADAGTYDDVRISADGRFVAFASWATNLVTGDTNNRADVFVHDLATRKTTRISVASIGTQGNNSSYGPSISADGCYVAFYSYASNLVSDDTNGKPDVFVHDRVTHETTRVSVDSDRAQANDTSWNPSISGDGRYVAFFSQASNLVLTDTNACGIYTGGHCPDVFVHDRVTHKTTRVSVASDGTQSDNESDAPSISADGRYVAFYSSGSNLVTGDGNGVGDVFVRDLLAAKTTRVSVDSEGIEGNGWSLWPAISADGSYVAFESGANNLAADDTNGSYDIFVRDRQTGHTTRVSVDSDGVEGNGDSGNAGYLSHSISADGNYVAFHSQASNLVDGDTNGREDVFVHDRQTGQTTLVSAAMAGGVGNDRSMSSSVSGDGRYVAFISVASDLVPGDTCCYDAFVRDRGPQGYRISGQVTFNDTGGPVGGVLISAGAGITATTDVSGTYALTGLAAGTYTLTATLPGSILDPAAPAVSVTAFSPAQRQDFVARSPDFDELGLEITQAVQDLANSVPLVAGKTTYVRFHVRNAGQPYARPVRAELAATGAGGQPLPNAPRALSVELKAAPDRGRLEDSYNFLLPAAWCTGTITVTAWVNPGGSARIAESDYGNNAITVTRTFTDVPPLRLRLFDVTYGLEDHRADPAHSEMIRSWLERAYPISALHVTTATLPWGQTPRSIAYREGSDWQAPGIWPRGGWTFALAAYGSDLFAGGDFTRYWTQQNPDAPLNHVAMFSNGQWSDMAGGVDRTVYALAVDGQGDLYAGGGFTHAGGASANGIARWDGQGWSALAGGVDGTVYALAFGGDGSLYAGGSFSHAGGAPAGGIARWYGNAWSGLSSGADGPVYALALDGSNLYAGGAFGVISGTQALRIARLDLTTNRWSEVGGGLNEPVYALAVVDGHLYAGGAFTGAGPNGGRYVARLDNDVWQPLGAGADNMVWALLVDGDNLYVGGALRRAGGSTANCVARWDTSVSQWQPLSVGESPVDQVRALALDGGDTLYAGGMVTWKGGQPLPSSFIAPALIIQQLTVQRALDLRSPVADARAIYYGVIDGEHSDLDGMGWPVPGHTAVGTARWVDDGDHSDGDAMAAHEIGHALGRGHVIGTQPPACSCPPGQQLIPWGGCCGCEPIPWALPADQHPNGSISPTDAQWAGTTAYGFDWRPDYLERSAPGAAIAFTRASTLAVYAPGPSAAADMDHAKDMMTYCPNQWISNPTYRGIMEAVRDRGSSLSGRTLAAGPRGATTLSLATGDYLFVSGQIDDSLGLAQIGPLYVFTGTTPPWEPEPGDYAIALYDADDQVLAEYGFTPTMVVDSGLFGISEWIPWNAATARVAVISGTRELAMVPVSPNVPTIALLEPNGGETLDGATTVVQWQAQDGDGGNLEYLVQYSADDGATWQVVGSEIANTTAYTVELASLPGTAQGRFRVTVSDGINTAWDMSDAAFTLESKRPRPQIQSPGSGKRILPHETLTLHGTAYDVEDGTLAAQALAWRSDIDGDLGQGLVLSVSPWSAGEHTITLTATDGDGLTATAAITLTVLADDEGDHMPDDWETAHGLDPQRDDSAEDPDGDSLLNADEYLLGTLPNDADTDDDGFDDALELLMVSDPIVPSLGSQVSLQFSGQIRYAAGHWRSFGKPAMAMLPGHYLFNFDSYSLDLDVEGAGIEKTVAILKLLDSHGQGIPGGAAEYYDGGEWHALPGSTDAKGALVCALPGLHTSVTFRMTHGGASEQRTQDVAADSYVIFQTQLVTVELRDSDGNPLDTGAVQYDAGGWRAFGDGSTVGGQVSAELLPGTYAFSVDYAGARNEKAQDVAANPTVVFQTGKVTQGERVVCQSYWVAGAPETPFNEPMQLLPGTYFFRLDIGVVSHEVLAGQTLDLSPPLPDVALESAEARYRPGSAVDLCAVVRNVGAVDVPATTIAYYHQALTGTLIITDGVPALLAGQALTVTTAWDSAALSPGSYPIVAVINQGQQDFPESEESNNAASLTLLVTPDLELAAAEVRYGEGSSVEFEAQVRNLGAVPSPATQVAYHHDTVTGTVIVTASVPALAAGESITLTTPWDHGALAEGTYPLVAAVNGGQASFTEAYTANNQAPLTLAVLPVTVTLQFSGDVEYYASSVWLTFTKPSMPMLPGTHLFRFDGRETSMVVSRPGLQATIVVVRLLDSAGQGLTGGAVEYDDGGWQSCPGSTGSDGALLCVIPGLRPTLTFRMSYAEGLQQLAQDVAADSYVVFQTRLVTVELRDNAGALITSSNGDPVSYHREGGPTTSLGGTTGGRVSKELLAPGPGHYHFEVTYNYATGTVFQDVATNPTVVFQTGKVTDGHDTCTAFWLPGGPEHPFTEPMQLLPGGYYFRLEKKGVKYYEVRAGQTLNLATGKYTTP